jgi:hypothetical protein
MRAALIAAMIIMAAIFCFGCVLILILPSEDPVMTGHQPTYSVDGLLLLSPLVEGFLLWLLLRRREFLLDPASRELVVRTAGLFGPGKGQRLSVFGVSAVEVIKEEVPRHLMGANIDIDPLRWHVRLLFAGREPERLEVLSEELPANRMAKALAAALRVELRQRVQPLASKFD